MSLDDLYMPLPAGARGHVVERLGPWAEPPISLEERQRRDRERWNAYRVANAERRKQYMRDYRARKEAA